MATEASNGNSEILDAEILRQQIFQELAKLGLSNSPFCKQAFQRNDSEDERHWRAMARWRLKDRIKTQAAALVLCLNIGVDPPDVIRVSPCARLECWIDPDPLQATKSTDSIAKTLQAQYERWQHRAKYKYHADPTVDDVKRLCSHARRTARNERALFHYNGHGVPRPTNNGEIWVFNRQFTQYIPVSVYDLAGWLGQPAIYVLDCSHAGIIVECLKNYVRHLQKSMSGGHDHMHSARSINTQSLLEGRQSSQFASTSDPMKEIIVLAACGARELLPQDSDLCADIFTACLTTPIKVAMRWSLSRGLLRDEAITRSAVDRIPGRQTDRKTMLGELNWILTSITDTIAWNVLPRSLFQKLFRQDLLVASLFRNFMLSERIMKACGCQPVSHPRLPPMHQHPLWESWDMTAEAALRQLPAVLADETQFKPSAFFEDQLTAFELWLRHSGATPQASPPQQLPIVLQVLLSQVHRLRALKLLGRFLDMGAWSVQLALSVGIFPYVLKLLQTTLPNLRSSLVFIWCKILASDKACQQDLVKDNAHLYFCSVLQEEPTQEETMEQALACRTQAVFVLTMICSGFPPGQRRCQEAGLLDLLVDHMAMQKSIIARCLDGQGAEGADSDALRPHTELLTWCMLALGKLCDDQPIMVNTAVVQHGLHWRLKEVVDLSLDAEVRAAAVFALGCLIDTGLQRAAVSDEIPGAGNVAYLAECEILNMLTQRAFDGSMLVRSECAIAIARAACVPATASLKRHILHFQQAFEEQQKRVWMAYEEHCNAPSGNGSQRGSEASVRMLAGEAVAAASRERVVGGITGLARSRAYTRVAHSDGAVARGLGRLDPRMPNRWTLSGTNEQPGQEVGGYDVDRYSLPTGRTSVVEPSTWLHASPTIHGTAIDEEPSLPLENTSAPGNLLATSMSADNKAPLAGVSSATSTSSSSDSNYTTAHQLTEALSAGATAAKVSVGSSRAEEATPRSPTSPAGTSGRAAGTLELNDAAPCDPSAASDSQLLLYLRLVEVLGILATDPAPLVAHHGRVTLQTSGHQVSQLPAASEQQTSQVLGGSMRSGSLAASMLGISSVHGGTQHQGVARLSTGALGHGRSGMSSGATSVASSACHEGSERGKWAQLGNLFRMPRIPGHQQRRSSQVQDRPNRERTPNLGQTAPISPASNVSPTTQVTTAAAPVAPQLTRENCLITPMPHMLPPVMLEPNHNGAQGLPENLPQAPSVRPFSSGEIPPDSSPTKIPESLVFKLLSQQFRQPQGGGAGASTSAPSTSSAHGSSAAGEHMGGASHQQQQQQQRRAACLGKIESSASVRAKELAHFTKRRRICEASEKPKLTEHVQTLETFCLQGSTAIVHHSADDIVTCVDVHGVVHAMDASGHYGNPSSHHINCYDVCSGAVLEPSERASAPTPSNCTIVSLFVLNELQSPTLMACAADGAVRVWDKHLERGEQQLVAAWQSVDIESTSFHWHGPTSYTMQPHHNILVASGGHAPENIFVWDLEREHSETVLEQFSSPSDVPHHFFTPYLTGNRDGAALIFAGGSDGIVRVFDLRQEEPVAKIRPHEGTLAGIAYRQQSHVLATASVSATNELYFSDTRRLSSSLEASGEAVFRKELAHNTGRIAALCAHPYAPLFASGSDRQVVKIWQQNGDMLSSIRAKPLAPSYQSLQLRLGKTTGMSFAPFDLKLALGAGDSLCSIYKMEQKNVVASLSQAGTSLPGNVMAGEGHPRENGEGAV